MEDSIKSKLPSYQEVRRRQDELNDLLKNLPNKLSDVSSNVDREFLSSYRVHMLSIQAEIKKLKQDVTQGEKALNSDGNVAKLETEVKFFIGLVFQSTDFLIFVR